MKSKWFVTMFGYFFLFLGIFDFIFKVRLYGFKDMDFLWFCSITMFILGIGMILKNGMLLNSFLSMAMLLQPFWMLDYFWLTFFNTPLNGVSLFVFKPGYSILQFILNARHMYMIPFGFFSVFTVSKKNKGSYLFIPSFVVFLLGLSYLSAPKYNNVNCVFKSCTQVLSKIKGLEYFFLWAIGIIIISLFFNFMINVALKKSEKIVNKKSYRKFIILIFLLLLLVSTISVIFAYLKFSKVPKYVCLKPDACTSCNVDIRCGYVDVSSENLTLMYTIKNYGNQNYVCDIFMKVYPIDGQFNKIVDGSYIEAGKKYEIGKVLPYPPVDSQIKLKLACSLFS